MPSLSCSHLGVVLVRWCRLTIVSASRVRYCDESRSRTRRSLVGQDVLSELFWGVEGRKVGGVCGTVFEQTVFVKVLLNASK
jgi:hypothetical protein